MTVKRSSGCSISGVFHDERAVQFGFIQHFEQAFRMTTFTTKNERALEAEQILREFSEYDGSPKAEILRDALAFRDELTPTLLEMLQLGTKCPISFIAEADQSYIYAAILLSYWQEEKAYPLLAEFSYLDEDLLIDLWGDLLTEAFPAFLYQTGKNEVEELKNLASDKTANLYIRSAAMSALNWVVADRPDLRGETVEFYSELLNDKANQQNSYAVGIFLTEWLYLLPFEYLNQIKMIMAKHRVEEMLVPDFEDIERTLTDRDWKAALAYLRGQKNNFVHQNITDYIGRWPTDQENQTIVIDIPNDFTSTPFERDQPKIGRNDPCICGSGKKFKKCCLH
jgi:hypothetical protein